MNNWNEIENILLNLSTSLDSATKEELIHRISIYHEEITLQNKELKRSYRDLNRIKKNYQDLFDFAPLAYLVIDNLGRVVNANSCAIHIFDDIIDESVADYVNQINKGEFYVFLDELFKNNKASINALFRSADGYIHMDVLARSIEKKGHYLLTFIDFEKKQKEMQKMNSMAYRDYLTGLYNRRYFDKVVQNILIPDELPISVILADVNGLKVINDAFGHMAGDELIKQTSKIMYDLCGQKYTVARLGGDEFGILLPNTNNEDARLILNKLKSACSKLKVRDIACSVSFGTATMTQKTQDIDDVIGDAEDEMYNHKVINEIMNSNSIIESIFNVFCAKYPMEKAHAIRVSKYMEKMGKYFSYSDRHIENLRLAGLYHNIGKIAINSDLILGNSVLTINDCEDIRRHPEIAYRILKSNTSFSKIAHIVLHHHEWSDGSGYPNGLVSKEIPCDSKILSICENFDDLTNDSPYHVAMSREDAIAVLESSVGTQFDEKLVDAFVDMLRSEESNVFYMEIDNLVMAE